MSGGLVNFYQWKCDMGGIYANGSNACAKVASMKLKMAAPAGSTQQQPAQRVMRDPSLEQLLE
ncbi:hypothetical protein D3C81_2273590 [compost metagenome]